MIWTPPAPVKITVAVDATGTGVAPKPTSDDSLAADNVNHRAFANCFKSGGPGCVVSGGDFQSGNLKYAAGVQVASNVASSMPSWITWTDNTNTLSVSPNSVNQIGFYSIKVQYDPPSGVGTAAIYIGFTIEVICRVSSVTKPSAPSGSALQYTVGSISKTFDFSTSYVQVPNCFYEYAHSFVWTGLGNGII